MEKLRELRIAKNINQQKLAVDLHISQGSISKYEKGLADPKVDTIIKLANYFGVTTDYLLGNPLVLTPTNEGDLSFEELNLLSDYRRLNPLQRQKLAAYAKGLSDS